MWKWRSAQLSNIPDDQTLPILILHVTFCYWSYILGCTTNRWSLHLSISFSCCFRGMRVTFNVLKSHLSFYQECWRAKGLWIRRLHSRTRWWSRRNGVKRCHNNWYGDMFGGLAGSNRFQTSNLGLFSSTANRLGFLEHQLLD